jgi:hypothetical protein
LAVRRHTADLMNGQVIGQLPVPAARPSTRRRHEILRAAFVEVDGVARQRPAHVCYELLAPMLLGAR